MKSTRLQCNLQDSCVPWLMQVYSTGLCPMLYSTSDFIKVDYEVIDGIWHTPTLYYASVRRLIVIMAFFPFFIAFLSSPAYYVFYNKMGLFTNTSFGGPIQEKHLISVDLIQYPQQMYWTYSKLTTHCSIKISETKTVL